METRKEKQTKEERHLVTKDIDVAGTSYHQEDLMKLAVKNDKEPEAEGYSRIYLYNFIHSPVTFSADPKNEHDPNAIKVIVNKQWIGFIPADECQELRNIVNNHEVKYVSCRIYGGPSVLWKDRKLVSKNEKYISASVRIGYVE